MKVTVDTNILVRAAVSDDPEQARKAITMLREAKVIAISGPCLCEFVWVLDRVYKLKRADISAAVRVLLNTTNVVVNGPAVDAGLTALDAGGDFADGLIAHEGNWLGGQIFVSFDKKAVSLMLQYGQPARLLS